MNKPNTSGFPGMNAMTDTLEFMKNMWGGMSAPGVGIPGIIMPTLSVEEIDKQIKDLKAVESWLNVNMTMLRSTIQALEVQSATISTLQAMGQSFSEAVKPNPAAAGSSGAAPAGDGFSFSPASKPASEPPKSRTTPEENWPKQQAESGKEEVADAAPADAAKPGSNPEDGGYAAPMANPAAWWNLLQDQFKQAVGTAMATESPAPAAAKNARSAAKPAAKKPAAKSVKPNSAGKTRTAAKSAPTSKSKSKAPSKA